MNDPTPDCREIHTNKTGGLWIDCTPETPCQACEPCHCGKPSIGTCPCCDMRICAEHQAEALRGMAEWVLGKKNKED